MRLRVHLLDSYAIAPTYAHEDDSGMDVYSIHDETIYPIVDYKAVFSYFASTGFIQSNFQDFLSIFEDNESSVYKIHTGLRLEIPQGYEIQVRSKSGLASKGIVVTNSPATIDEGYRGELVILLHNIGKDPYEIKAGQKVAQIVLAPVAKAEVIVMQDGQRLTGGFGSTGV